MPSRQRMTAMQRYAAFADNCAELRTYPVWHQAVAGSSDKRRGAGPPAPTRILDGP